MLHYPQTISKYFKKIFSKDQKSVSIHFRPFRSTGWSTVVVSGQNSQPAGRSGLMAVGVHVCARLPVDRTGRPLDPAVDRLHDPYSRVLPVDRAGRPTVHFSILKISYGRPGGLPEPTVSCQVVCRSTGRSTSNWPDWLQRLYFESVCF